MTKWDKVMTVKQLIEKLKNFDENLKVYVDACHIGDGDTCAFFLEDDGIYVDDDEINLIISHFG